MDQLLFLCIIITALDIFLIIYAFTIPLYPQKWRNQVNKKYKNETVTVVTMAACFLWIIYFYFLIFHL